MNNKSSPVIAYSIIPWLSVSEGASAILFYKSAFDAEEVYHLDAPDGGVVSRLSVNGAEFWISDGAAINIFTEPPVRMILTVSDPDTVFAKAIAAGAKEVYPVGEGHGWRIGRIVDPYGHHWEIGYELSNK